MAPEIDWRRRDAMVLDRGLEEAVRYFHVRHDEASVALEAALAAEAICRDELDRRDAGKAKPPKRKQQANLDQARADYLEVGRRLADALRDVQTLAAALTALYDHDAAPALAVLDA